MPDSGSNSNSNSNKSKMCKTPTCNYTVLKRGVCRKCFSKYSYLVTGKKSHTWDQLVELGLIDPPIPTRDRYKGAK